jgi:7,8-dihydropterin-6-yl-methyl-4-(beta-D-ribofuranosyl)aminobenzene 5'-phosphate synthase
MADQVEITILVDNSVDIFLPSMDVVDYPVPGNASQLWAEQGLSLWIEVSEKEDKLRIMYDFGRSRQVLHHNVKIVGLDLKELDFLVLSHGHVDHYGCLPDLLEKTMRKCKLMVHPEALVKERYIRLKDGSYVGPWKMSKRLLSEFASRICSNREPTPLGYGVYLSGEIERKTPFETGMPNAFAKIEGQLVHDEIEDDQSLFIELGERGVIVLTGCCHAGLINTMYSAQRLLPGRTIYALIGGFHLNQAGEGQMKETIAYLLQSDLRYISGFHCTGYHAQKILMERFQSSWIPSTVGAKIRFSSQSISK